ncbi:hypothetical protein TYRP_008912 [Tyrophagus putrescentiae]|nr:hypothetical protein TYRP_008912 [Tyrophagus putrescentiae]
MKQEEEEEEVWKENVAHVQRIDEDPEKEVAGDGPEEAVHVEDVQRTPVIIFSERLSALVLEEVFERRSSGSSLRTLTNVHKGDDGGAGAGPDVPADHADQAHEGNDQLEDGKDEEVGGVVLVGEHQAHGRVQGEGAEDYDGPGVGQALLRA